MIQTLKLGLTGSETELPSESRINDQGSDTPFLIEARSVNGTLHTDFISLKENHNVSWEVISVADYEIVNNIIKLQYTNGSFLNFIYTDSAGLEISLEVRASVTEKGRLVQVGDYYYGGCALTMEQV